MSDACHGFDKVNVNSNFPLKILRGLQERKEQIAQITGSRNLDGSKVAKFLVG